MNIKLLNIHNQKRRGLVVLERFRLLSEIVTLMVVIAVT